MKTRFALLACVLLAVAALAAAPARAQQTGGHVDGTITAAFDPFANPPGWYGFAYLSIGKGPVVVYRMADLNTGGKEHPAHFNPTTGSGNYNGFEQMTITSMDGLDSFQVDAKFVAVCSSPYSCMLNETGDLVPEAGTGQFAGMKGTVAIHGPFAGGDCVNQPCIFIGQLSGSVSLK